MTPTPNPTAEKVIADAITAYWADEERSGPNRGPEAHDRECGIDAAKALRAHGLLSEGAPSEEPSDAPEHSYEAIRTDIISALAADGFAYLEAEQLVRQFEMLVRAFEPDAVIHSRIRPRTQSEREAWDDGFACAAGAVPQERPALDLKKVAETVRGVIDRRPYSEETRRAIWGLENAVGRALCEAYTEGKLT